MDLEDYDFFGLAVGTTALEVLSSNTGSETGYDNRVELTLNYPRTAAFLRMTYDQQCDHYRDWIDRSLYEYNMKGMITKMDIFYERCRSGNAHVHLDIWIHHPGRFYKFGFVGDIVKEFLMRLPKRWGIKTFAVSDYSCLYDRYRCPAVCCQLCDISDTRRALQWETYIRKDI